MRKKLINFLQKTKKSYSIVKNFYNTPYNKNILICYNVNVFLSNKSSFHTNYQESHIIAKTFSDLGFNIDIISFDNPTEIDFSKYDVLFGFGLSFEKSFSSNRPQLRIYYATGAHLCHQNQAEILRVCEVNEKKSSFLKPKRLQQWALSQSTSMSDAMIIIGNEWTKSTYEKYCFQPLYCLNATSLYQNNNSFLQRDINMAKMNFLWFGSGGLVHKGLDLCLDFFSTHPKFHLHICGPVEEDFYSVYNHELNLPNIHLHGFIDVNTNKFIEIMEQCLFSIMPSCSEGQSTALLTTMATGLIPLASKENGKNIDNLGFLINDLSPSGIKHAIHNALAQNDEILQNLSRSNIEEIRRLHSLENFTVEFNNIIKKILYIK